MILNGKEPVEAKLVGSTLVAAFHQSTPSLIWKFDLERNHSFTLALQGEEGDLELGVTSSKGEFYPIARFTTREDADQAFEAVQKALMTRQYNWPRVAGIAVAAIVGFLFLMWTIQTISSHMASRSVPQIQTAVTQPSAAPMSPTSAVPPAPPPPSAEIRNGVPLPADQILVPPP